MSDPFFAAHGDTASRSMGHAPVRCYLSASQIMAEVAGVVVVLVGMPVGIFAMVYYWAEWWAVILIVPYIWLIRFASPLYDYYWVELDGDTLRGKHLYLRHIAERNVADIKELKAVTGPDQHTPGIVQVYVMRIHFQDRWVGFNIAIHKPKMHGSKALIEAIIERMEELGEVGFEMYTKNNQLFVRRVYWKQPPERQSRDW